MKNNELRKYLSAYLPYDLYLYDENQESKIDKMIGIFQDTIDFENWSPANPKMDNYKLVLLPLSYLTKVIEINGENKRLIDDITLGIDEYRENADGYYFRINNVWYKSLQLSYWQVQILLKHRFDVFGLIEKGLAIDKNTL